MSEPDEKKSKVGSLMSKYDNEALPSRRASWANWYMGVAIISSIALNLALVAAILLMLPLKTVEPVLVQLGERSELFARVIPFQEEVYARELVDEAYLRQYVLYRHAISPSDEEMRGRWEGFTRIASTDEVFRPFVQSANDTLRQLREAGITRSIEINRVSRNPVAGSVYDIEYTARDFNANGAEVNVSHWVATAAVTYAPNYRALTREQRIQNPLGFLVTSYGLVRKEGTSR